jgi:short-chain Z-isoprenyl diphosphate synthase
MSSSSTPAKRVNLMGPVYSFYEKQLRKSLDPSALPRHIAVMADGNRRWAKTNAPGQPLVAGYQAGADKLRQFVQWCDELGIGIVTLWVLSTENLKREPDQIESLLKVISHLAAQLSRHYRLKIVGDLSLLPDDAAASLRASETASQVNDGMQVNMAVSYGGRHELRDAMRALLREEAAKGTSLDDLAEHLEVEQIEANLYTKGQPDPDLIIRTSGEQRLSGFLTWQSAHSEFYFCEALWPDFRKVDFYRALRSYAQRERRYGK